MDPSSWPAWARQVFLLFAWCIIWTSVAQDEPAFIPCLLWGHRSAVVHRKLYIDGGLVNNYTKEYEESSKNFSSHGIYTNLSKNHTIPSVNGGILWEDSVNKRLYLSGGEYYETPPSDDFILYSYDILYDEWVQHGPPKGAGIIDAVSSYGAGISIPSRGEADYYGGWLSNKSVPDWKGLPRATNRLIKYMMDSNSWNAGMLVYFGGTKDLYGNGTLTPQPLDQIFLFDVASATWYTQMTSGHTPKIRRRFCGGATWAQDGSSYNIYIYGGAGFPSNTADYDDIYILTIPSFQWIRGPYPPPNYITGDYPKMMTSCNVVDYAQMVIIGGTNSGNYCSGLLDANFNMNLGEQNSDNDIWWEYQSNLTTYAVPTDILTAVGGRQYGGATRTAPTSGFDDPDLTGLMTRTARPATRTPTRKVSIATTTTTPSNSGSLSAGAIAGIAVGCSVALILALIGCYFFILRRRKSLDHNRVVASPPVDGMSKTSHHDAASQEPEHRDQQWVLPAGPPAELTSERGLHYGHQSSSPTSGRLQSGSGDPPAELAGGRELHALRTWEQ
ncbi:hypothetical protein BGZ61DRAFT_508751 [Ilyonectria robusta]|uniref:uncharacterized protein n=1 Tax=Ilyonectria robusta TaxID=1079257 RepID=UPI001E8E1BA6|nr:uncharacterized protein BGZ61DRAFT_508751 [Ilyonectria robusta]KAH8673072.1 hypothetical protein BGZ61DRAFT_508751 [Ilyonectria robusta]